MHWSRDDGFSMMEVLGVIAIGLILAGAAVVTVPRFLDRGRDASATASLTTAVTEARELYTRVVGTGRQNFTGRSLPGTINSTTLTAQAVTELNAASTNLCYYSILATTSTCGSATFTAADVGVSGTNAAIASGDRGQGAADEIRGMGTTAIWVHVTDGEDWNSGGDDVRAGNMIRMGVASDSGATYCAMLVADSTVTGTAGAGFMARSEATSNSALADNTGSPPIQGWAHCGLQVVEADRDLYALSGSAPGAVSTGISAPQ